MKKCISAGAVIMALMFTSTVVSAEMVKKANYVQGHLGFFMPAEDLDDSNFDTGGSFDLSYGRYLSEFLKVEAGWDVFAVDRSTSGTYTATGYFDQDDILTASGLAIALFGEFPAGSVDVYGGAGIGIYGVFLQSDVDTQYLGDFSKDEDDTVFGAFLAAGLNYNFTKRVFLGVEARYRWTSDVDINECVAGIPIAYEGDLSGFSLTFGGGYRF